MKINPSIPFTKITLSVRAAFVRNLAVAFVNGAITLMILLIAPLGLAAVVANTVLVTVATAVVGMGADAVVAWLLPSSSAELLSRPTKRQPSRYKEIEGREREQ